MSGSDPLFLMDRIAAHLEGRFDKDTRAIHTECGKFHLMCTDEMLLCVIDENKAEFAPMQRALQELSAALKIERYVKLFLVHEQYYAEDVRNTEIYATKASAAINTYIEACRTTKIKLFIPLYE